MMVCGASGQPRRRHVGTHGASPLLWARLFGTSTAAITVLLLMLSTCLAAATHQVGDKVSSSGSGNGNNFNYFIVIDAGSTGSRAFVYQQDATTGTVSMAPHPNGSNDAFPPPAILEVVPGLSSYAENPKAAYDDTFHTLLRFADSVVPAAKSAATPLFVRGTAGLRRISAVHRRQIFDELAARTRRDYQFIVASADDAVPAFDIMPGDMEGVYAWLAINHKEVWGDRYCLISVRLL